MKAAYKSLKKKVSNLTNNTNNSNHSNQSGGDHGDDDDGDNNNHNHNNNNSSYSSALGGCGGDARSLQSIHSASLASCSRRKGDMAAATTAASVDKTRQKPATVEIVSMPPQLLLTTVKTKTTTKAAGRTKTYNYRRSSTLSSTGDTNTGGGGGGGGGSVVSASLMQYFEDDDADGEANELGYCRLAQMRNKSRWEIHQSILDCVGQTPIVKLKQTTLRGLSGVPEEPWPRGVNVFVKCENTNPGGSLKDRLAVGIIEWAEKHGKLKPGQTVVEASSGNTGVGMAMVCAAKGYPFVCVMSEAFSMERRKLMRFLGARVILTPKEHKATGMLIKAQELAVAHGFFYAQQFENEANAWIHEQTTGPEILKAFDKAGQTLHHFFMAYGTGGTILGISRAFRNANNYNNNSKSCNVKIHLCEPTNAPMVSSGIPTKYPEPGTPAADLSTAFSTVHPLWSPHVLQGWATDFIPKLLATAKEEQAFSQVHKVAGSDAIQTSQYLSLSEGIFVGISGGGILHAAVQYAKHHCEEGTNVLAIVTDTGERYLSTQLFEHIPVEMTPEELALSASTPGRAPPPPLSGLSGLFGHDTDQLFDM